MILSGFFFLQMGIHDIFEPTHADFSPMTDEDFVYTRHVEQSVTVNIRTQSMEQLKSMFLFLIFG